MTATYNTGFGALWIFTLEVFYLIDFFHLHSPVFITGYFLADRTRGIPFYFILTNFLQTTKKKVGSGL